MAAVRIHLAYMSPLLRGMITDLLACESDIEILSCANDSGDAILTARANGANMIITHDQERNGDRCLGAVMEDVPLTILAIDQGGSAGTSINLVRRTLRLDGEGPEALAQAVRQAIECA